MAKAYRKAHGGYLREKCKSINNSTNPTLKVGGILITKEERTNMSISKTDIMTEREI